MFTLLSRLSSLKSPKIFPKLFAQRFINIPNSDLFSNGSVLYSKSKDIFFNLSLEDWIYRNIDLKNKKILLFWTNSSAVVIGRHQNPWTECHLRLCKEQDVPVVRRNSGGGTVYHDLNNLNLSFICDKKLYNRLNNLSLIRNVLSDKFRIDSRITEREDLVMSQSGHKISGTASKVGAHNSYHHLTLLIDADMTRMRQLIRKESKLIKSKATESIRSKTTNLITANKQIQLEDVLKEIALYFTKLQVKPNPVLILRFTSYSLNTKNGHSVDPNNPYTNLMIDPKLFNGIEDINKSFRSWEWIYGKTPRFTVTQEFCWEKTPFLIEIHVFHGVIEKLVVSEFKSDLDLEGIKFTEECVDNHLNAFLSKTQTNHDFEAYLCDCIKQCVEQTL